MRQVDLRLVRSVVLRIVALRIVRVVVMVTAMVVYPELFVFLHLL